MTTDIKPGQTWASKKHPTERLRVDVVRPAHVEFKWEGGIMHVLTTEEFLDTLELVDADAPAPVRLTGELCAAMPLGTTTVETEYPWKGRTYVKTSPNTWAYYSSRPTPDELWKAVNEQRNNLSPHPSGLAYVFEPTDHFATGDSVRRIGADFPAAAERGMFYGRTYTVRDNTVRHDGVISVDGVLGMWNATDFELVARAKPQPTPEPEWKPGATGTATLNKLAGRNAALGMRVMRFSNNGGGFVTETGLSVLDSATTYSVSDFVPDAPAEDVVRADLRDAQDSYEEAYQAAAPDLDMEDRTEPLAVVVERLRTAAGARTTTTVHVTKATTHEELADALAQHYGDHASLAAVGEPSTRQNYLDDAAAVMALLGGES